MKTMKRTKICFAMHGQAHYLLQKFYTYIHIERFVIIFVLCGCPSTLLHFKRFKYKYIDYIWYNLSECLTDNSKCDVVTGTFQKQKHLVTRGADYPISCREKAI